MPPVQGKILGTVVLALSSMLLALGCGGSSDPPPPGSPSAAEFLINASVIGEQPKGSPQEALLLWWRAIQYNDLGGYENALSAPLRNQREADKSFPDELQLVAGEAVHSQPKVESVEKGRGGATLFTRVETRQPVGASRYTTTSTPQAFTLVQEDGAWKIDNDFVVTHKAAEIEKALKAAEAAK